MFSGTCMKKQIAIHSQYKMTQLICSVKYVFQACELWLAEKIFGRKMQPLLYLLALLACNANKVITMQTFFITLSLPRGAVNLKITLVRSGWTTVTRILDCAFLKILIQNFCSLCVFTCCTFLFIFWIFQMYFNSSWVSAKVLSLWHA